MTTEEFSNAFDTLVGSYKRFKDFDKQELLDSIEFDEYEKSLFLSDAQEEIVVELYTGKNAYGEGFEKSEEIRKYLSSLVRVSYTSLNNSHPKEIESDNSYFFECPSTMWFVVYEAADVSNAETVDKCVRGRRLEVVPVTHDEYNRLKHNPFRGANKRRVLRLDVSDTNKYAELVSVYPLSKYYVRYLIKPTPIVLENMPNGLTVKGEGNKKECLLHEALHQRILERAVEKALRSKGISVESKS